MPMSFPDMRSLLEAADLHKFRQPQEEETVAQYRQKLAKHVEDLGHVIEGHEIRTKNDDPEKEFNGREAELLLRAMNKNVQESRTVPENIKRHLLECIRIDELTIRVPFESDLFKWLEYKKKLIETDTRELYGETPYFDLLFFKDCYVTEIYISSDTSAVCSPIMEVEVKIKTRIDCSGEMT